MVEIKRMAPLPPYIDRAAIGERLIRIFPSGTPNRNYCVRELAASTVFTALYIGAIEGSDRYLGPVHVYRMTAEQAKKSEDSARLSYAEKILSKGEVRGKRWYADNTREPIRDETLRDGLVAVGAVLKRDDLPTTSGLPRYTLKSDFAALFNPKLAGDSLDEAIAAFQRAYLTKSALARITIAASGAVASETSILVTFPNGETRNLSPGPSSIIARHVIEVFAKQFLDKPAIIWLSESGNKVVFRDEKIAKAIGLNIQADKNLPDLILADLGPKDPLIVFVEIVATDGAVTERRRSALFDLTDAAGFDREQVAFVTAYLDRDAPGFRKTFPQLAWRTFAWFAAEPTKVILLRDGNESEIRLSALLMI